MMPQRLLCLIKKYGNDEDNDNIAEIMIMMMVMIKMTMIKMIKYNECFVGLII